MNTESKTPRTDDQAVRYYDDATGTRIEYVAARFARQLERERDEAQEQRDRLAEALFMCRRELVDVLDDINKELVPHDGDDFHEALRISKEALAAVKGGTA